MKRLRLFLAIVLSFGLFGCTFRPASFAPTPTARAGATAGSEAAPASASDAAQAPVSEYGTLQLTIRWPERPSGYQTALIPTSTNALTIKVASGSTVIGSATVSRNEGETTASAVMSLKAANNLSVEVLAYREASPVPTGASPIAQGTGNVNITRSKKTSASLVLTPLLVPTITALSRNSGVTGDEVTLSGTNFGSGSIPVFVYFNGTLTVGATRSSETSLTVQVPPWAPTGKVVVKADGVTSESNMVFWVPSTMSIDASKPSWDPSADAATRVVLLGTSRPFSAETTWFAKFGETTAPYGTPPEPTWTSTVPSVGTLDSNGLFTAGDSYVASGTEVTASFGSKVSNSLKVLAEDVTVSLSPTEALRLGSKGSPSSRFQATNVFSDGATNSAVSYESSQAASVSIDTAGLAVAVDFGSVGDVELRAISAVDARRVATASVTLSNYVVTTLAGRTPGYVDGAGSAARFANPHGMAMGPDGCLYVADNGNGSIRKITPEGDVTTVRTGLDSPYGIAVDSDGTIYTNSGYCLVKIQGRDQTTLAGTYAGRGMTDGFGAAASFSSIKGLALDAEGNVYVSDYGNSAIRKVTPEGFVSTLAGDGSQGFRDGTGEGARFDFPYGVAVDRNGNVFVADGQNSRIRKVTPEGVVTTVANGQTNPTFGYPFCIAIDGNDNLFFSSNGTIHRLSPDGRVSLIAGGPNGASEDGIGTSARFNYMFGIAAGADGTVYVSDTYNCKIRKLQ